MHNIMLDYFWSGSVQYQSAKRVLRDALCRTLCDALISYSRTAVYVSLGLRNHKSAKTFQEDSKIERQDFDIYIYICSDMNGNLHNSSSLS